MAPAKPLPDANDPLTAPFWAATKQSRLVIQQCEKCRYLRWPPTPICPECQNCEAAWVDVAGNGVVWSFATYYRALDGAFGEDVPYTVALIELDSGPRMLGTLLNAENELVIGAPVRAVFDAVTPDVTMVRWKISQPSRPS